jgi:hypothetical protein
VLALAATLFAAIYLLGPAIIGRFILDFAVPRRSLRESRSEEIARSIIIALLPIVIAALWATLRAGVTWGFDNPDVRIAFSTLYGNTLPPDFFDAAQRVLTANWSIIWRLYLLTALEAGLLFLLIFFYGTIRHWQWVASRPWLRTTLTWVVLPRVSEWHALLTGFNYPRGTKVEVNIMTKSDILYRGKVEEPLFLKTDGTLAAILISGPPERFMRTEYLADQKKNVVSPPDKNRYWKEIPSKTFMVLANEIETINIRVDENLAPAQLAPEFAKILAQKVTVNQPKRTTPANSSSPAS